MIAEDRQDENNTGILDDPESTQNKIRIYDGANVVFENLIDIHKRYEYIVRPLPIGQPIMCKILRNQHFHAKHYYELYMEGSDRSESFLLSGKLLKKNPSDYVISLYPMRDTCDPILCGRLKSNIWGTLFNGWSELIKKDPYMHDLSSACSSADCSPEAYNREKHNPVPSSIVSIIYEPNIMGLKGPRKMTVILPQIDPLKSRFLYNPRPLGRLYQSKRSVENLIVLNNKLPQWCEETGSYVLNFNGRVSHASVKNFQVVHENNYDYIIMQFGRVGSNTFAMDCQYPISVLQAFLIALSSFDSKLICE